MQLRNHIAYRFLTDPKFTDAILRTHLPEQFNLLKDLKKYNLEQYADYGIDDKFNKAKNDLNYLYQIACIPSAAPSVYHKSYYITKTVNNSLDYLNVSKSGPHYNWTIFKDLPDGRHTFIFTNDTLLRFTITGQLLNFLWIGNRFEPKMSTVWIDRVTNEMHPAFDNELKHSLDEVTLYKLLCFIFLSENEERIVPPGKSYGTRKQPDALSNDTNVPVTIVNSCWNITSIRTEGFNVSGHLRVQPCGPGLSQHKIIFIEPFKKNGYIRKALKPAA